MPVPQNEFPSIMIPQQNNIMNEIVIKIAPFVFKQTVYIRNKTTGSVIEKRIPQKDLADFITSQDDLDTVHLFGNEKITHKIEQECLAKYNYLNCKFKFNE